ncbi:MAG: family 10 glycosylhydrolase [Waterburya sp.]
MQRNAGHVQQYNLLSIISPRLINNKLTKLITILFTSTLCPLPAVAQSAASNITPSSDSAKFKSYITPGFNYHLEPTISPGKLRLMTQELEGLIGRFKTTLLTADANHSKLNISTNEVIQQILEQRTIIDKQNQKQIAKSNYRNSHQALQLAVQKLETFRSLASQRRFAEAQEEWSTAQKVLWDNYPSNSPIAESEVRGMWLDRGTIVKSKSEADLVEIFDRMALAGINTVFFETLNSSYTIYPSQVAPQQNPLVKGWDPLRAAVKLAHERGMELHAWVWTFAAGNQRHNTILNLPRNYLGPVLSQRPHWAITDHEGSRVQYSSGKVFLDPANPEVREYLLSLVTELATNYQIDGIHLDYIRYPFQSPTGKITYGYGIAARQQFQELTGVDPIELNPSHSLWSKWTEFRIEQVDNFVGSVSQNLKQLRPELTLSTAVFPMPQRERLSKIQQSWEKWVRKEWIDMLVPMTYAKDTGKLHSLTNPLLSEFDHGKALLLPGIRLLNISEVVALDQMQLLRGMSTQGYALFAAENLNPRLTTIFNSTQGERTRESKKPLPHREPFRATLSRYQGLQQEWNFFLTQNSPAIEDTILRKWGQQADQLRLELQNLIDEPSGRNFFSAQITLNSLRRQFPSWMEQTKDVDAYQAKVWQSRLDTLDRLLSYGERKSLNNY